ncbi:bile salt-activated lipase-like isoform X1 [Pieris napi]|uniref:bile salt-activated lipase-like isoform X1 n=2 Tax=Pieris napi TaxID=78633 RepID=UPI001FB96DEE|nr:bile salt-activated lipase-like isoform X1 [Pieris napi]
MLSENSCVFTLKFLLVPILVCVWEKAYHHYTRPLVLTKNGWVRGLVSSDGDYDMFFGIPYGKVRTENPFGVAEPYTIYDGVFEATDNTKNCPQLDDLSNSFGGTLDCLNLNIYVPRGEKKLPVMVYIFGGRFMFGFAGKFVNNTLYGPQHLVRYGVIYVVFNYRLGPYGFLCPGTREVPGNTGLKDQTLAIRWIKDNIEHFGGDVNKITLFGHSSGAISVDHQVHTQPYELFQRAILQSGTSLFPFSVLPANNTLPSIIARKLGYVTDDVDKALKFLAKKNPLDVVKASVSIQYQYTPCIEPRFEGVENIITDYSLNTVPKVKNRRFLIGHTKDEYNFVYAKFPNAYFDAYDMFEEFLSKAFHLNETEMETSVAEVKRFYKVNKVSSQLRENIVNFTSDIVLNYPLLRQMERFLNHGSDKIYYYVFTYYGGRNLHQIINNLSTGGAMHADEVGYIYPSTVLGDTSSEDQLMVDRITTLWTNFAKYGDPTPSPTDLLPEKWYPISRDSRRYLQIDRETKMETELVSRIRFWKRFYEKYSTRIRY